jgi:hypothetical protein
MSPSQLAEVEQAIRKISDRARALVDHVGEARINIRPAPGKWSIGECFAHLNITASAFLPVWSGALRDAPRGSGPYRLDFWGRTLCWLLEAPPRLKIPAPGKFLPPSDLGPQEKILPTFLDCQERILKVIAQADGYAIDRINITSPFSSHVDYNVWSSFCITAAHERRHLWQADRVADVLG